MKQILFIFHITFWSFMGSALGQNRVDSLVVCNGAEYLVRYHREHPYRLMHRHDFTHTSCVERIDAAPVEEDELCDLKCDTLSGSGVVIDAAILSAFTMEELKENSHLKIDILFMLNPQGEIVESYYLYENSEAITPQQIASLDQALFKALHFSVEKANLNEYRFLPASLSILVGAIYSRKSIGVYEGGKGSVLIPADRGGIGRLNP